MDEKIFGYEKDGDTEYRAVDKRVPNFLSDVCDKDLLESRIPSRFMVAPKLEYLYREIMRQVALGTDRGMPPGPWRGLPIP